jgi:tRNA G18 (ribose-2'-O)-methylase SpoU
MPELPIERVDSLLAPELAPYRTLRRASLPAPGLFVAEGSKVVFRMLESGIRPVSFLLTPDWLEALGGALPPLEAGVRLYVAERPVMQEIVGFRFHQGLMALGRIPAEPDPELLGADHLVVALDDIHHAENVGVIIRNAAALGARAVVAGETCSDPWLRRSVRNSMGGIFRLPVFRPERLREFLLRLRATAGTRLIAADARAAASIASESFRGSVCVVAGNEEAGVRSEILKICDARISIPMERNVDSLNVASAVAVFLHAARACRA